MGRNRIICLTATVSFCPQSSSQTCHTLGSGGNWQTHVGSTLSVLSVCLHAFCWEHAAFSCQNLFAADEEIFVEWDSPFNLKYKDTSVPFQSSTLLASPLLPTLLQPWLRLAACLLERRVHEQRHQAYNIDTIRAGLPVLTLQLLGVMTLALHVAPTHRGGRSNPASVPWLACLMELRKSQHTLQG